MFPSKKRAPAATIDSSPVEVEVSFDMLSQLYSIVVTEASNLQSIVSVPSTAAENEEDKDDDVPDSRRLADCLRPSSPLPRSRHSALERGRSRSLPPMLSSPPQKSQVIRDISCPPMSTTKDLSRQRRITTRKARNKPNLVSKTAARATRRLFGRRKAATRQIIPAL